LLLQPFANMSAVTGPITLQGSSRLIFNDSTNPLICVDLAYACFGIYFLAPALDPDLSWPLPFVFNTEHTGLSRYLTLMYVFFYLDVEY
jgi:hypothetical protein